MDDAELEKLLKDLESDRVERKASPSDRDKIRQAICAFANDLPNHQKPGVLFMGLMMIVVVLIWLSQMNCY